MTREEAIEILIAVAVCDRPILSCDFCARHVGIGTDCTYPSDKEIEESVLRLKGASNDAASSAIREQDVADKDVGKMTNAQKIRSMSDEELAWLLHQVGYEHRWGLEEYVLEWLQMPAEEDDHE